MSTHGEPPKIRPKRAWNRADGTPVRVLIVDDEPTYREYLERFLARDGLSVRTSCWRTGCSAARCTASKSAKSCASAGPRYGFS